MSIIQFKLTSGDEIICEVLQEPEGEDPNLVVRNAMKIYTFENPEGTRFYSFRPWMTYQDSKECMQLLNYAHIVGEAKPAEALVIQYQAAAAIENTKAEERDAAIEEAVELTLVKCGMTNGFDSDNIVNNVVIPFDRNKLN